MIELTPSEIIEAMYESIRLRQKFGVMKRGHDTVDALIPPKIARLYSIARLFSKNDADIILKCKVYDWCVSARIYDMINFQFNESNAHNIFTPNDISEKNNTLLIDRDLSFCEQSDRFYDFLSVQYITCMAIKHGYACTFKDNVNKIASIIKSQNLSLALQLHESLKV